MNVTPVFADLSDQATEAATLLKSLANRHRLMILCALVEAGEMNVGAIEARGALSQSALSQHLAKLREQGLVTCRREAQTLHYRIADPRVEALLERLHSLFCAPETTTV